MSSHDDVPLGNDAGATRPTYSPLTAGAGPKMPAKRSPTEILDSGT